MKTATITSPGQVSATTGTMAPGPGRDFMRAYAKDVLQLTGATSISSGSTAPDEVTIRFASPDLARLADNVLKDSVVGARLVIPDTDKAAEWWSDHPGNMIRSVTAMQGVHDHLREGKRVAFFTTTTEHANRLGALVSDSLGPVKTNFVQV